MATKTAKTAAKAPASKAPATRAPRKAAAKTAGRKVATTGYVWSCECGKTSSSSTHPDLTVSGRCPLCDTPLTLQEQ